MACAPHTAAADNGQSGAVQGCTTRVYYRGVIPGCTADRDYDGLNEGYWPLASLEDYWPLASIKKVTWPHGLTLMNSGLKAWLWGHDLRPH